MPQSRLSPTGPVHFPDRLCLDFTNTAAWHASAEPQETLSCFEDLLSWAQKAKLLTGADAQRLRQEARQRPRAARAVLRRAIELREAIYRIVVATLRGRIPDGSDLGAFNRALAAALPHRRVSIGRAAVGPVRAERANLTWDWAVGERSLDWILWPIVVSAADLLTSKRRRRIGQCADDRGCGWLFLDASKNRSRRWCEMQDCGNRAKARRHYQRTRARTARFGA